jgi:hypothetical protein
MVKLFSKRAGWFWDRESLVTHSAGWIRAAYQDGGS